MNVNASIRAVLLASFFGMSAHTDIIAINFGKNEQDAVTGDPTADYVSANLGITVTSWDYEGTSDWSGNGTTFNAANGAPIGIWHDAANTWRNDSEAETSALHGYLDDGDTGQNYVHLTGLSAWLASSGDTAWRMTVLRSTDSATGFSEIEVTTGNVTGETGWLGNGTPTGGATAGGTIPGTDFGAADMHTFESNVFTGGSSDGVALHYIRSGTIRASVAGVIIQSVPEPSSAALLGLAGALLFFRRRKR